MLISWIVGILFEYPRDDTSKATSTYRGLTLIGSTKPLHLRHFLIGRRVSHGGLLRVGASLSLRVTLSGVGLGGVVVVGVVLIELVVVEKSGIRGAGVGVSVDIGAGLGREGGRRLR